MAKLSSAVKTKGKVVSSTSFSKSELDVALQLILLSREVGEAQWDKTQRCSSEAKRGSSENKINLGEEKESVFVYSKPRRKKRSRPLADLYQTTEPLSFLHVERSRSMENDIL